MSRTGQVTYFTLAKKLSHDLVWTGISFNYAQWCGQVSDWVDQLPGYVLGAWGLWCICFGCFVLCAPPIRLIQPYLRQFLSLFGACARCNGVCWQSKTLAHGSQMLCACEWHSVWLLAGCLEADAAHGTAN